MGAQSRRCGKTKSVIEQADHPERQRSSGHDPDHATATVGDHGDDDTRTRELQGPLHAELCLTCEDRAFGVSTRSARLAVTTTSGVSRAESSAAAGSAGINSLLTVVSVLSGPVRIGESLRAKTVAVTAFSLVSAGLLGVAAILIARQLGPSGRGEFAASYSLAFLLVILGSLGAGPAGRRLLSIGNAAGGVSLDVYQSLSARLVLAQLGVASVGALVLLPVFGAADSTADRIAFVACCVGTLSLAVGTRGTLRGRKR